MIQFCGATMTLANKQRMLALFSAALLPQALAVLSAAVATLPFVLAFPTADTACHAAKWKPKSRLWSSPRPDMGSQYTGMELRAMSVWWSNGFVEAKPFLVIILLQSIYSCSSPTPVLVLLCSSVVFVYWCCHALSVRISVMYAAFCYCSALIMLWSFCYCSCLMLLHSSLTVRISMMSRSSVVHVLCC